MTNTSTSEISLALHELSQFLYPTERLDVKALSIHTCLALTATKEGRQSLINESDDKFLTQICTLLLEDNQESIRFDCLLFLINLTADEEISLKLTTKITDDNFWFQILSKLLNPDYEHADAACKLLSNMTHSVENGEYFIKYYDEKYPKWIEDIIEAFLTINFNKKQNKLDYLSAILANLTQIKSFRKRLLQDGEGLSSKHSMLRKLFCFTNSTYSTIRRGSVACILKNCCFDHEYHYHLLKENDDFLCALLHPLAGPEDFTDKENEELPVDLQYLPPDKVREKDPDIKKILLDALLMLCTTKSVRLYFRRKNVYLILREYHQQETNRVLDLLCEKIIQILIGDETPEYDNLLTDVDIPNDLVQKFEQVDQKEADEISKQPD